MALSEKGQRWVEEWIARRGQAWHEEQAQVFDRSIIRGLMKDPDYDGPVFEATIIKASDD